MIRSVLQRTSVAGLAMLLACIALNQACAQSYSLWPSATPANANDPDASSVELGVKFTSSVNGTVSAIRFYKSLQNTGTHTVALWTSGGAKLASATAANETASGWQTVTLSAPINIAAGTTYVASYHAPYGHYADDQNYFAYSNGVLAAPRYAGVYTYSTGSSFPTSSWNDSNYWVDIVFNQASLTPVNGACGSSNGADLTSAPTTNLCSAGAATTVTGSGPWSWSCAGSNGGTMAICSANDPQPPVNGACGSANGAAVSTAPTSGLCTTGSASAVSGSGPWSWSCAGSSGGSTATCSAPLSSASGSGSGGGGNVAFTALHTYYMSPTGSDSNNGTSPSTPWATPNHSVNCGDVIIAAAGSYPDLHSFGTVSNCPSTSGGIDGTGGIYFATLLCGAASVGDCYITTKTNTTGDTHAMYLGDNWAVEGWYVNTSGFGRAFESYGCQTTGSANHHVAVINDISANNLEAFDTNDCGNASAKSTDYAAVVGTIAQNSAQDGICLAAIDIVGPGTYDTAAGTHFFIYGNFSYAHLNHCGSDVEDYMFDTWDFHNVNNQGIIANNIGFDSSRMCIQMFWQANNANTPRIKIYNNTCFQNNVSTGGENLDAEINIATNQSSSTNLPWVITVQNNIAYQPLTISSGSGHVAAFAIYNNSGSFTNGASGTQNVFSANNGSCTARFCNSTFDAESFGTSAELGTNTYTNPAFTNTTDLLANRVGVPNCSGFATTTACMGWNANTSKLTTPSVISDLTPNAIGTSGKGYQKPSTTCAANADYPNWLKGVVYLHWNGSALSENSDLVTKPCNM